VKQVHTVRVSVFLELGYYYYYYYYIIIIVTGFFLNGTSFESAVTPTIQASSFTLQYFHVLCVMFPVQLSAVLNLTNVFLVMASRFFIKLFVTIPVASIITRIIVHFRFHIRCISVPELLHFNP
jgi:hypothetical protein